MPAQKIPERKISINEEIRQTNSETDLEKSLKKLMDSANTNYNAVYNKSKNNPDIKKFSSCRENFQVIKSTIESTIKDKGNTTSLTNKLYLEAWISMLYSDVHALALEPETEKQLNKLSKKIQAIDTEFKQLLKKMSLDSKDESSIRLLNYIGDFEKTWKTKKEKLLADVHYNFAETLVEKSDYKKALKYFKESRNFYKNAAKKTNTSAEENELLEYADQTNTRLNEVRSLDKSNNRSFKTFSIRLQRLPAPTLEWVIKNEEICVKVANPQLKRKTELSNEDPIYPEAKKLKEDLWS